MIPERIIFLSRGITVSEICTTVQHWPRDCLIANRCITLHCLHDKARWYQCSENTASPPQLQAVTTEPLYQIKVRRYFSVSPKADSCVFRAVASGFYLPSSYSTTVLELGSVCCISAGDITSGVKLFGINLINSNLISSSHLHLGFSSTLFPPGFSNQDSV